MSREAAAEHWNIDLKRLEAKGYLSKTPYEADPRNEFLRLKGFIPEGDDKKTRPTETHLSAMEEFDRDSLKIQARRSLAEIMELPDSSFDRSTESQTIPAELSFDSFVAVHPEWGKDVPGTFVFFRDHPKMKQNPLIQRVTPGLGTLVACAVLQHYLVALANDGVAPTLDIACWLRKHAPSEVLERHIFVPHEGGDGWWPEASVDALVVLPLILNEEESSVVVDETPSFEGISNHLRRYGPVLLDRWDAFVHLTSGRKRSSYGCVVLVVGSRTFDSGGKQETRLLLQRWWRQRSVAQDASQFMEIDFREFEYQFRQYECKVIYVTAPQKCIHPKFDVTTATFSWCTMPMFED
jgi:hypothetical protein